MGAGITLPVLEIVIGVLVMRVLIMVLMRVLMMVLVRFLVFERLRDWLFLSREAAHSAERGPAVRVQGF